MATNTSQSSSLGSVSFLNIFGVFISIVLCILFIILGGHALKYIKEFACKIKIIVNRAQDKNVNLKDYNYKVGGETKQRSQGYEELETIYKNEIKKSRSLQYWIIVKNLIAKYDHILYYPFREKVLEQYDMLKPKTSFYTLLVVLTCCIAWMTTIFLSAILQNSYSNVTLIPLSTFVGLTIAIAIISSVLNIIATNRLFRIYLLTVKAAFKVDYGHKFEAAQKAFREYEPENSEEEDQIFKYQGRFNNYEIVAEDLDNQQEGNLMKSGLQMRKDLVIADDINIDSSRKLLHHDMDRSDKVLLNHQEDSFNNMNSNNMQDYNKNNLSQNSITPNPAANDQLQTQMQLNNSNLSGNPGYVNSLQKTKSKAIKDVFDLQVDIEGADDANTDDKYIYIEDKHAIGDLDLLENEALKGENSSNIITFAVLFVIIAIASGVCCYLNYTFSTALAQYVFYMFIASFFGDIIVSRPLLLMVYALFRYCKAKKRGYKKIEYKQTKEIKDAFNQAIKDMFVNRRKYREEQIQLVKNGSSRKTVMSKNNSHLGLDPKGDRSQDPIMGNYSHLTQNGDRNETITKQHLDVNDPDQEDQFAREIIHKHDDDNDGGYKINMNSLITRTNPTDFARPQIEDDQKNFEKTQNITQYNTSVPLLSQLKQAIKEKEEEQFSNIMDQKQLNNDLVDYNLLLLRKIYDAYEERADKVLKNFRKDNRGVIRKRYMMPILNPNYDYEKLLQEMMQQGKGAKEDFEEESVKMDGMTVCEDFDQQLMQAIIEEASDDLYKQGVDRQRIDKFGNPIDDDKLNNGIGKVCPCPSYEVIEMECEENQAEDDEYARRMKMLEDLRRRIANGEELTAEELALLEQLENERLKELEQLIQAMLSKSGGYDNLSDEDKLTLIGYQKEKCHILLDQEKRKKPRSKENEERIDELNEELKRLELEELKLRAKMFGLTDEELDRLYQLEQEKLDKMMKRIKELETKGWDNLSTNEKFELLGLKKGCLNIELDRINRKKPPLSQEDLLRIKEIEDELLNLELQELLLKEQLGMLTDADKLRLKELSDHFANLERLKELDELEELRKKLLNGTISEEELRRLRELEAKYGLEHTVNPFEQQIQLNEEFNDNMQDDEEDIMHSRITDQDNFQDLPPVEVMNNLNQSPGKLLADLDGNENNDGIDANNNSDQQNQLDGDDLEAQQKLLDQQQKLLNGDDGMDGMNNDDLNNNNDGLGAHGAGDNNDDGDLSQIEKQNQLDDSNIDPNLLLLNQHQQDDMNNSQNQNDSKNLSPEERERLRQQQLLDEEQQAKDKLLRDQQQQNLDDEDLMNRQDSNNNGHGDDDMAFGRDDLEIDNAAAIAADGESVYSHKTSAILDEEKVSFMHIDHLQNEEVNSDESFAEQDMVYYDKDDLTRFSENRGINRVKRRQAPQYYSENDLQEVKEGDFSEGDSVSGRSAGGRSGRTNQRGYLSHNQLETQSHEDLIEGRVKVDAWNLNYRKKKKKQKKRKVTDNNKRKMQDLQEIYGVDARTLANLKKGPLPRKQLAKKGKMTDDDFNQAPSRMISDNSFRTTMNTFQHNTIQQTPAARMQQSQMDNQSNMFSFNGFGATRQNWGNGMNSRFGGDMNSQYGKGSTNKKYPLTGMKKLTETQQKFNQGQNNNGQHTTRDIPQFDEESKSAYSASRSRGASNNRFNASNGLGSNNGGGIGVGYGSIQNKKAAGKGKKGMNNNKNKGKSPNKSNKRRGSEGLDSHTESDEAVDDKGAMFQRRNKFNDFYGNDNSNRNNNNNNGFMSRGGMNDDIDHSESEEGNNQDIPNFQGNDFMFKKRGAVDNNSQNNGNGRSGVGLNSKLGKSGASGKLGQSKGSKKGGQSKNRNNRGSGDELNIEDLEAQSVQQKTGKKGQQSSMKKGNKGYRGSSAERQDSEEENDGGQVMFQKRNKKGDYQDSDHERSGLGKSKSNSKPPLSNRRAKRNGGGNGHGGDYDEEEKGSNHLYGDPYNVNGRVHPGVSNSIRHQNAGGFVHSDLSDNERQLRGTKYSNPLESDGDLIGGARKRNGGVGGNGAIDSGMFNSVTGGNNRMSDQLLKPNKPRGRAGMNNRSVNGGHKDSDEDDYIVGPESNHSSIKKRPFQNQHGRSSQNGDNNDEHYLLMQRERQIMEDIESDRGNNSGNLLAKKRKIRKAGKSQNVRDAQQQRYQELQRERLKKMKREAEGALFSQENDLESGKAQLKKKKKVKKETVKKEINYWLDYDSPYAEYLVARFREWSPNPNLVRVSQSLLLNHSLQHPSANAQRNSMERSKYSEVVNVYSKNNNPHHHPGRASSNNSRSRDPDNRNKASLNNSASRFSKNGGGGGHASQMNRNANSQLSQNQNLLGSNLAQNRNNNLFVDDFEEP